MDLHANLIKLKRAFESNETYTISNSLKALLEKLTTFFLLHPQRIFSGCAKWIEMLEIQSFG